MHTVLANFLILADKTSFKRQNPPNKTANTRHEKPKLKLLAMVVQEISKIYSLFLLALVALPEVEMRLSHWRHHTLQKQSPETSNLELTRMVLPWGLAFMIQEGMWASKAEKQQIILPSYDTCGSARQGSIKGAEETHIPWCYPTAQAMYIGGEYTTIAFIKPE